MEYANVGFEGNNLHIDESGGYVYVAWCMESTAGLSAGIVFGPGRRGAPGSGRWRWSSAGIGERVVRPVGIALSPVDGALYVSSDGWIVGDV